jgi:hypothetical protein
MVTHDKLKDHWAEQQLFLRRVIGATIFIFGLSMIVLTRRTGREPAELSTRVDAGAGAGHG